MNEDPRCDPGPLQPYFDMVEKRFDRMESLLEELKREEATRSAERHLLSTIGGWVVAFFGILGSAAGAIGLWHGWDQK